MGMSKKQRGLRLWFHCEECEQFKHIRLPRTWRYSLMGPGCLPEKMVCGSCYWNGAVRSK